MSELLGKATIDTNTYGRSRGRNGSYSTNYQLAGRELMTPNEVQQMDNRKALLFIRGEKPVMDEKYDIRKHPYVALTPDGGAALYSHGGIERGAATMERLDGKAGAETLWAYLPEDMDCELLTNEEIEALYLPKHNHLEEFS